MSHVHAWNPIPMEMGKYECACGATGRRIGKEIIAHAEPRTVRDPTARLTYRLNFRTIRNRNGDDSE